MMVDMLSCQPGGSANDHLRVRTREHGAFSSTTSPLTTCRAGRELAATGVGDGLLGGPVLLHIVADAVALVSAFGGQNAPGETFECVISLRSLASPDAVFRMYRFLSLCLCLPRRPYNTPTSFDGLISLPPFLFPFRSANLFCPAYLRPTS